MTLTAAVLPLKSLERAKSRLGDGARRSDLAAAMAADVLAALARVRGVDALLVVSRSRPEDPHVTWVPDHREDGHVAAALLGIRAAVAGGAGRVLLVPGDCPALQPAEVEDLLAAGRRLDAPYAVVVPDRHGTGTNALLLCPPDAIRPAFGPGSFARHAALARASGVELGVAEPPSLLLDVDTPDDLRALEASLRPGAAPRTRALLAAAA